MAEEVLVLDRKDCAHCGERRLIRADICGHCGRPEKRGYTSSLPGLLGALMLLAGLGGGGFGGLMLATASTVLTQITAVLFIIVAAIFLSCSVICVYLGAIEQRIAER